MAKRLKLRICRAIATTLQSCRSTDPSILPQDPVPSFSTLRFSLPADHQPHRSAAAFISAGPATGSLQPLKFKWQKEEKWHVVDAETAHHHHHQPNKPRLKIYNAAAADDDLAITPPSPPLASSSAERNRSRRKKKKKKKNIPSRLRLSTSSADSGWFSSEGGAAAAAAAGGQIDEEETETLVSSSESSSFNPHRRSKRRGVVSKKRTKRAAAAEETAARLSVFKKLIPCAVEGKVKESFAVVKRSDEPYEDFKESMMEMIVEKQMFEERELEQLLQCFLSLNSRHYHGIIVQAFSEIWGVIFSPAAAAASELSGHHLRRVS